MAKKHILLNNRDSFYRVDISMIVYFEANGAYTTFVLCNKQKGVVCMSLAKMKELLVNSLGSDASIFVRVGRRFIINREYVYRIDILRHNLVVTDGASFAYQLPISREALKELRDLYLNTAKTANPTNTPNPAIATRPTDNKK